MGEMSKIEEVARGMYDELTSKNVGAGDDLRNVYVADQIDLIALAKAAIDAMRGPTETMLEAGTVVDDDFSEAAPERACFMIYHAMLDAALKE